MEYITKDISLQINALENAPVDCIATLEKDKEKDMLAFFLNKKNCFWDLEKDGYHFSFVIRPDYFSKYEEIPAINFTSQTLCCNMQSKLIEILYCKAEGIQRKIFIESRLLGLIDLLYANQISIANDECGACCALTKIPIDADKIRHVKEYIIDHLHCALTIPKLASVICTNECYLKKGFKQVYGKTIFEFIQENRMAKANRLLSRTDKSLMEIADVVGYTSVNSFRQAYKAYFGVSPRFRAHSY